MTPGQGSWEPSNGPAAKVATSLIINHDVPGLFINRHQNLAGWVGQGDDLRLVSAAQGQDLKYVLLRLQRAAAAVEQGIKTLGLQGFKTEAGGFVHEKPSVGSTGFQVILLCSKFSRCASVLLCRAWSGQGGPRWRRLGRS